MRVFALALLPLLLALLLACGGGDSGGATGSEEGDGGDREMAADYLITVSQGQDILGGEQVAMASLVGEKPVVLNFWAAECPPCRAELPEFQKFYGEYREEVLVLGIDLGQFTNQGTPEQGRELLAELGVTFPAGYTEDSEVLPKYTVLGLPTTIFINADGSIHDKWTGALSEETLIEKAEEMLDG
jgi:thiol-disulfide isomerase/thioredoxin